MSLQAARQDMQISWFSWTVILQMQTIADIWKRVQMQTKNNAVQNDAMAQYQHIQTWIQHWTKLMETIYMYHTCTIHTKQHAS